MANAAWNGKLAAGGSTTFGFTGSGPQETFNGCTATINGAEVACSLGGVVSTPTVTPTATPTPVGDKKVIGYYPGWATYGRDYQVTDIPASKLTHINYAFANIAGGKCVVGDSYADTAKVFPGDSTAAGAARQLQPAEQAQGRQPWSEVPDQCRWLDLVEPVQQCRAD